MVTRQNKDLEWLITLERFGYFLFSLAIAGIGLETLTYSYFSSHTHKVVPVIPWLPVIPSLVYPVGVIFVLCATGLLFQRTVALSSITFGSLMIICALLFDLLRHPDLMNAAWRTNLLEPLVIGSLAWLAFSGQRLLQITSRYLIAFALVVFGIAHFQIPAFIASLVPDWIPGHQFWTFFFGLAFIAAGLSFATGYLEKWAAIALGLMFGLWLTTIHLPALIAMQDADKWSDLFIVTALCGGFWMVAPVLNERPGAIVHRNRRFEKKVSVRPMFR